MPVQLAISLTIAHPVRPQSLQQRTICRGGGGGGEGKAFKAGKFSVEDDTRLGRTKTSVTKAMLALVTEVLGLPRRVSSSTEN